MPPHLQEAKRVVLDYHDALGPVCAANDATSDGIAKALGGCVSDDYFWRGMHPFYEQRGAPDVADVFWQPLVRAMAPLQRRCDVFFAGDNDVDGGATTWVCSMGHLIGRFDGPWLDIPPTRRVVQLRYAEFSRVADGRIAETTMFLDLLSVMRQAGHFPLPPPTGQPGFYVGPRTGDGLLHGEHNPAEGRATLSVARRMAEDLSEANRIARESGEERLPHDVLARCWHEDMLWIGPDGIGSSYTIERYRQQHSLPFRFGLTDKEFHGHVARLAEGRYAAWFGWANVSHRPRGGFLGLPASGPTEMRVVDVYRRDGDKLADNWVFIDLLHWLSLQGLEPLERMRHQLGIKEF